MALSFVNIIVAQIWLIATIFGILMLGGFVDHDVHLGFESLGDEVIEVHYVCIENAFIV